METITSDVVDNICTPTGFVCTGRRSPGPQDADGKWEMEAGKAAAWRTRAAIWRRGVSRSPKISSDTNTLTLVGVVACATIYQSLVDFFIIRDRRENLDLMDGGRGLAHLHLPLAVRPHPLRQ